MSKFLVDKTWLVELASALSFILMSVFFASERLNDSSRQVLFWIIIFSIFGFLQLLGVVFGRNLVALRICMAWVAGSSWTWLMYSFNGPTIGVPMLIIGLCNLYAFAVLCSRASINWPLLFEENA